MILKYKNVRENPNILKYMKEGDAGIDLAINEDVNLNQFARKELVGTGVAIKIPPGHFGFIVPRSSCGKLGLGLANTVGIIDSGYTGEIMLMLYYLGDNELTLVRGSRVAQLIIVPFTNVETVLVEELDETERGAGGFGHTGLLSDAIKL